MENKAALRRFFLEKREALSQEERAALSQAIVAWLQKSLVGYTRIMAYWPIRGEVDVVPLLQWWLKEGRDLFLPRVRGRNLDVVKVKNLETDMFPGYAGIPEAMGDVVLEYPEVILVPGVAFDEEGFRLGYGAGFYDRFLSRCADCRTIGVAYRFQVVKQLPHHDTDIPVQRIVCEDGWIR
ncbi:5-formyltetrahydrofolate cyclo-ligase [Thermospira aquatica]|uniref:5-formyltetrahydrofolate cyclo-ligase n=1 Tax=Thermospira aquatica TaxID=2828656 RepID=A0AAX3BEB3_9SPIR|nr:5-formyltetrahydrofolate cyclo-ligase [Thermospira aquatica]URA10556.1 5-formyltetrahydrofolate cyclo-ligase [Thermospira aquatica]